MNVRSSRSHIIFRMVCCQLRENALTRAYYVIHFQSKEFSEFSWVCERRAKNGAGGVRLKEGKHINKSLTVLGNVIYKLSEDGKQRGHIPYCDGKLTRILQSALGGNAKTSIICTLAPEEVHIEETKGKLQFASRAKCITNHVQVNEVTELLDQNELLYVLIGDSQSLCILDTGSLCLHNSPQGST